MKSLIFLLILTAALAPSSVLAGQDTPAAATKPASPMVQEMLKANEAAHQKVAVLTAERANTTDPARIMAIDAEIGKVKHEANLEMYRIQIRHFTAAGNTKAVAELETILEKMTNPRPVGQPRKRAAPVRSRKH